MSGIAYVESDAGLILTGMSISEPSGYKSDPVIGGSGWGDIWLVRLDFFGEYMWDKTIGGNGEDLSGSIVQSSDGNFMITAGSSSSISGNKTENSRGSFDYWIVTINPFGEVIWDKTLGGSGIDSPQEIIETNDGNYLIVGNYDYSILSDLTGKVLLKST